jgi:hypothetical protein
LGAARERPPLYAPRPPLPGVWPRAADARPLVPSCGPSGTGSAHKPGWAPSRGATPVRMRAAARGGHCASIPLIRTSIA